MAVQKSQVYKCSICGNVVEVVHAGAGTLVCCGVPMDLLSENTTDAAREKHVPVIEKVDGGVRVKVGSVAHPMEEKHFIEWIELIAVFPVEGGQIAARAFCNLHGLWKAG